MRIRKILPTLAFCLVSITAFPQRAALSLDTSPDNRCAKSSQGGLWIVRDTTPQNNQAPQSYILTVTLLQIPALGGQPINIVRVLTAGASSELGCSQGNNAASYQIVSEK